MNEENDLPSPGANINFNTDFTRWIVGFRSKNILCIILSVVWYLVAIYGLFSKDTSMLHNMYMFFAMIAIPYLVMGIVKYKKYSNSLYIILIGAVCFLLSCICYYNAPEPDNRGDNAVVSTTQTPAATSAATSTPTPAPTSTSTPAPTPTSTPTPTKSPEQAQADLEKSKQKLNESIDSLKESLGIEDKPEDVPFNPVDYTSAPSYEELARYPGNYENGRYKFYGEIIQVSEGIFNTAMRLKLHDDYDQIVYCEVPNDMLESRRILEHDFVTMYGIYKGVTTYKTILGASLTVPKIRVTQWMN